MKCERCHKTMWKEYLRLREQQAQDHKELAWYVLETARRPACWSRESVGQEGGDEGREMTNGEGVSEGSSR